MSEPWARLKLTFEAAGNDTTHVVSVPLYAGDDILGGVEKAGVWLVNGFAKDAAHRLAFAKASRSVVDSTVDRLNGVASSRG